MTESTGALAQTHERTEEYEAPQSSAPSPQSFDARQQEIEVSLAALREERDVALARAEGAAQEAEAARARISQLETHNGELMARHLQAHRRALLAEHAGQVVPELVAGSTADELETSVEGARAAYARIAESVTAQIQAQRPPLPPMPAGASPRSEPNPEELSPIAKITAALSRNNRR